MAGPLLAPDVLVLAAGGVLGEAWMTGLLAGVETATGIDFRRTEQLVGTSAGSIVAASLAAGRSPRRPRDGETTWADADSSRPNADAHPRPLRGLARAALRAGWSASAPLAAPALALRTPGGAIARSLVLARVPGGGRSLDDLRRTVAARAPRFDGRLRIAAVDRATGRRVVFGAPGAPPADVADAVAASCAVPWLFAPVRIGGREYVDGGVWSITNLDAASVGRDTEVLCLNVMASLPLALTSPLAALRTAARASEAVEAQALRRRGAHVRTIGPDAPSADAIGPDLMDARRADRVLAAGHRQGLATARA